MLLQFLAYSVIQCWILSWNWAAKFLLSLGKSERLIPIQTYFFIHSAYLQRNVIVTLNLPDNVESVLTL